MIKIFFFPINYFILPQTKFFYGVSKFWTFVVKRAFIVDVFNSIIKVLVFFEFDVIEFDHAFARAQPIQIHLSVHVETRHVRGHALEGSNDIY